MKRRLAIVGALAALALVAPACGGGGNDEPSTQPSGQEQLVFGMLLVGPKNDHGWSQAHYEAGKELEKQLGAKMILLDKVNPADRPETSVDKAAADMISQGAQLIFATSDDMKDGVIAAATQNPDVPMIWASGDTAWADGKDYMPDLKNLGNIMGRMEYGKMIAGCAAALTTETGHIGYLGALINDETRRLANSAFLGARYCWATYRSNGSTDDLKFDVNWIGFWFNIPGQTLDPTQVTNSFFDSGADVVMSGIDTTEALVRAGQRAEAGDSVFAVPYDYTGACGEAPEACIGVPYFNWTPSYLETAKSVMDGTFKGSFEWLPPDWSDINNLKTTAVGFEDGPALSADNKATLDEFIAGLGDESINLYTGPLNYQDGTAFLGDGETATDTQVWYAPQLLEGMNGASSS